MSQQLFFSVVIPVYNRPQEVEELLESLLHQQYTHFETIIVEDGSQETCEHVVNRYKDKLSIQYFFKDNSGPGDTRNYGAERAKGDFLIFFDSDCLIPPHYFQHVVDFLAKEPVDAFGGADQSHPSFTPIQKAISYAMTSFFTTGGIRGGKNYNPKKFHPRSFNMGFSREVFLRTGGFAKIRFGEDIDMSLRILKEGFTTSLIKEAFVYHKRRTDFKKFFKQVHNSGIARINLFKLHPHSLKLVHFLPACFTVGIFVLMMASIVWWNILPVSLLFLYCFLIFIDALFVKKESLQVAFLCVPASFVQLVGYGTGFIRNFWRRLILRKGSFEAFKKNFYK